ncbi:MAG TPA: hypothetical protein PK816_13775, partial [Candidatus Cloacimonadota bacterium]|nr:hypothetical protein [Candidatus Cloacimonadota bacterium]
MFHWLTLYSQWPEYTCEFPVGEKGASGLASVPYLGTFKAITIWATGPNPTPEFVPEGKLMPTWWKNIFNNSYSDIAN